MYTVRQVPGYPWLQSDILSQKQARKRENNSTHHYVLAADKSSVPSTHVGQLTTVSSHSFKLSGKLLWPPQDTHTHAIHHTQRDINKTAKTIPFTCYS